MRMPRGEPTARALGLRLGAGFVLYLALCGVWLALGAHARYDEAVKVLAVRVLSGLAHFPIGASEIRPLEVHNQGFVFPLLVALALVGGGLSLAARFARLALLGLAAVGVHGLGLALQLDLALALKFQQRTAVPLLLPWELEILKRATQLLFVTGLSVIPFLAIALTAWWSLRKSGSSTAPRRARVGWGAVALILVVVAATSGWILREIDPRHVAGHLVVGNLLWGQGRTDEAVEQYGIVVRWGGKREAAGAGAQVVEQALRRVPDATWRRRLTATMGHI
jgi:hypothetical protein